MGYLYIIRGGKNTYKVGITKNNPHKRLQQLQTGAIQNLQLVKFYKTRQYKELERKVHKQLAGYRVRNNGEWFSCRLETITKEIEKEHTMSRLFGILITFIYWIIIVAIATIVLDAIFNSGQIITAILDLFWKV